MPGVFDLVERHTARRALPREMGVFLVGPPGRVLRARGFGDHLRGDQSRTDARIPAHAVVQAVEHQDQPAAQRVLIEDAAVGGGVLRHGYVRDLELEEVGQAGELQHLRAVLVDAQVVGDRLVVGHGGHVVPFDGEAFPVFDPHGRRLERHRAAQFAGVVHAVVALPLALQVVAAAADDVRPVGLRALVAERPRLLAVKDRPDDAGGPVVFDQNGILEHPGVRQIGAQHLVENGVPAARPADAQRADVVPVLLELLRARSRLHVRVEVHLPALGVQLVKEAGAARVGKRLLRGQKNRPRALVEPHRLGAAVPRQKGRRHNGQQDADHGNDHDHLHEGEPAPVILFSAHRFIPPCKLPDSALSSRTFRWHRPAWCTPRRRPPSFPRTPCRNREARPSGSRRAAPPPRRAF